MNRLLRSLTAILLSFAMLCAVIPAFALITEDYNSNDVARLRAFFELTNSMDYTNGYVINGSSYDPDDPSTWGSCTWNGAGRLTAISFNNKSVVGDLDLSGCSELLTVVAYQCRLTGLNLTGCSKVTRIEADHNKITELNVTGCPKLSILMFSSNKITELDVTHNPLLTRLDCGTNSISVLNVTGCPLLTYLDCGVNKLTELDVTNCTQLVEFTCKDNLLTELDVTNCTQLERFRCLRNRLRYIDISVLNGGVSFILDALGDGCVGTACNVNSSGAHTLANAEKSDGSNFYGWYEGDTQLSTATQYECAFDGTARHYTAHFDVSPHDLTIEYVYENGAQAAPTYTSEYVEGTSYSVTSPTISGYIPDIAVVSGVMGHDDITVTVTYAPPKHTLRIFYKYENGSTAGRTYSAAVAEGASYSVASPAIANYVPDPAVVQGVMGTSDITVNVVYHPEKHDLTVYYLYDDGSEAAPAYTAQVAYGASYSVDSPTIQYFTPDITCVEGVMGSENITVTVTYTRNTHRLTIKYLYSNGSVAAPAYTEFVGEGLAYSVTSPTIQGYMPNRAVVSGVMGMNDVTVTVVYTRIVHELIISYQYEDGSEAADEYVAQLGEGDSYSVASPAIPGYIPSRAVVSGVMGTTDINVTVVYTRIMHELIITYRYEDGSEAAEEYVAQLGEGDPYSVDSPVIDSYTADITVVEGVMGESDVHITVTYTRNMHELRIRFVFDLGDEALPDYVVSIPEGEAYSVPVPVINGYYTDVEFVEGVMGEEDIEVTVVFHHILHELRIFYVFEDGSEAAPEYAASVAEGGEYSVDSPVIDGYTADIAVVEGVMGESDVHITVTYTRNMHELRIRFVFDLGDEALPDYVVSIPEGEAYSVPVPVINGYYTDVEFVEGVMGEEDIEVTVVFHPILHELRIFYVFEDGSEAAPEYFRTVAEGVEYSVDSPVIDGYTPDIAVVEGVMGESDLHITVTYTRNMHELRIRFVFDFGDEALPDYVVSIPEGEAYSVPVPVINGYYTDVEFVEGVMGTEDIDVTVVFHPILHELRIFYVFEDGSEAAPEYAASVAEGGSYSVPSPVIEGYTADIELVEGVMGEEDIEIVVTYSPIPVPEHELKIVYVYENGEPAADEFIVMLPEGEAYCVPSPEIDGYFADIETVEGVMGEEDIAVVVTYSPIPVPTHTLTVRYLYQDGSEALPDHVEVLEEGMEYSVPSPVIEGYTADTELVEGVMGEEDITVYVTYIRIFHELHIQYVYEDGSEAAPEYTAQVAEGDDYSVDSPEIEGYYANIDVVSGRMGNEDVYVTVTYTAVPVPTHELRIRYMYEDGSEALPDYVEIIAEGVEFCVPSPVIEGYAANPELVEGVMGEEDITVNVVYVRLLHELHIRYIYEDGSEAAPDFAAQFAEGEAYGVPSPEIEGYTADIELVEGVMGEEDIEIVVTYSPIPVPEHELKIVYVYENGEVAADEFIVMLPEGEAYGVPSPEIEGYTADIEFVEGVMGEEDIEIVVTYSPIPVPEHELRIIYVYENGEPAADEFIVMLPEGEAYSVPSPEIEGYTADIEFVEGVMGEEDIEIVVTYSPIPVPEHELRIIYVYENGEPAADEFIVMLPEGEAYGVPSPEIEGYTADIELVEGVMGEEDVCITVVYHPIHTYLLGDVDNNGVVNSNDALVLLRYTLGIIGPNEYILGAGDVDCNGYYNANDVLLILRASLGIIQL